MSIPKNTQKELPGEAGRGFEGIFELGFAKMCNKRFRGSNWGWGI